MFDNWFWFGLTIAVLGELVLHWFPWLRPLPRIIAYALGMTMILIAVGVWLIPTGRGALFAGIGMITVAAGLATLFAYGVDRILKMTVQLTVHDDSERD